MPRDARALISRMSRENPLWGAPRIHGELLKLGIEVSEATVTKYLARLPKPPSQTWRTFFRNHADCLASIDFFVLSTTTFRLLMVFIVLHHERRQIVHFGVTANPNAAWVAQQITEAFPWRLPPNTEGLVNGGTLWGRLRVYSGSHKKYQFWLSCSVPPIR